MHVEHEGSQRSLQPRQRARENDEAGAGELDCALEVHEAERLADFEVLLRAAVRQRWLAPATDLDVGALVGAVRHLFGRQVGQAREQFIELDAQRLLLSLQRLGFILQRPDLGDEG